MREARALPILFTVLVVAVGACIPLFASAAMDRQLEYETKQWEDTSVSLVLSQEGDIFQALKLFRSDHSQVELSEGDAITAQEAKAAAMSAALMLALDAPVQEEPRAVPMLFASSAAPVPSGIFWCCTWGEGEAQTTLWIDDRSGRMVALDGRVGASDLYVADSPLHESVFSVLEYCRTQYSVDSVDYSTDPKGAGEDVPAATEGDDAAAAAANRFASYTVTLSRVVDGRTEKCAVPLQLNGERIYFNL